MRAPWRGWKQIAEMIQRFQLLTLDSFEEVEYFFIIKDKKNEEKREVG